MCVYMYACTCVHVPLIIHAFYRVSYPDDTGLLSKLISLVLSELAFNDLELRMAAGGIFNVRYVTRYVRFA